ncbi:MAG TPA: right-handed parallel beta-helix repeat-containing protein [Dehalococcoidia bacterium]
MPAKNLLPALIRPALIAAAAGTLALFAASSPIGPGTETVRAGGPVVTRTGDPLPDGCKPLDCSLREAIESTTGGETISFNIAGDGPHVIKPTSPLPGLTDSVTIDGYTQPGAIANTAAPWQPGNTSLKIVLDGSAAGIDANGLIVGGASVIVRGLAIGNFARNGIMVTAFGNGSIRGNYIGTDATGTVAAPNGGAGVNIHGSGSAVGGTAAANRNLIAGNAGAGIEMAGEGPILIAGNFIGTDVTGAAPLPNGGDGIHLRNGPQSLIGESDPGAGNLISGNGRHGLTMEGPGVNGVNVRGNRIGTAGDGETPLPNFSHGIYMALGAFGNTIGGVSMANWNTIAFNGGAGVALANTAGENNYLDPNITHSNSGLGVDLKDDGVTLNDQDDTDTGPNTVQNFPVVTRAEVVDGVLFVEGTLNSVPGHFYTLFIFANSECDPSGYGEGERFLGEDIAEGIGPDYTFFADFELTEQPVFDGEHITMSASNPESTSEFSECVAIEGAPAATPTPSPSPSPSPTPSPTPTPTPSPTPAGTPLTWGDLDCTNGVNPIDSLKVLRADAGLGNVEPAGCPTIGEVVQVGGVGRIWGDVDCSTALSPVDALKILREDAGLGVDQPEGCPDMGSQVSVVT